MKDLHVIIDDIICVLDPKSIKVVDFIMYHKNNLKKLYDTESIEWNNIMDCTDKEETDFIVDINCLNDLNDIDVVNEMLTFIQ